MNKNFATKQSGASGFGGRMVWFMAASFIAFGLHSFAGDTPAAATTVDLAELNFEQLASVKVATVYGASKHEQKISEAPSFVTIVTRDDIQKFGYRTLKDILNSVPGFYMTSDGVYDYIGIRGFNQPGDYGGRILITIDGHRMNDAIFDQADSSTAFPLDVDMIERVEIIRGSGSSLYGNNAFFAVINIISRQGQDLHGAEVSGSYGSYDTFNGRFSYGDRFTNGMELALSGSYLNSGGNDDVYFPEFSAINHGHADDYGASEVPSFFASVSYKDFSFEGGYSRRTKIVPNAAYGTIFDDQRNRMLDERGYVDLKWHHVFDNDLETTARVYYDHVRYDGNYPFAEFDYGDPLYPGIITMNFDRVLQESLGGEVQFSKTFFVHHRVTAGAEYRHDFMLQQRNYDEGGLTYMDSNPTADTVGVYIQDEYAILSNLILNAGARYDYFSSFGYTINPRAALIYSPCTNSTFKLIYGQAFRAPNAFELYYVSPGYTASQELKPETIHSYELNYEQVITRHLKLTASLFYHQVDDLISFGLDSSGTNTFGNLAGATSLGGEIELDANWAKGWRTRLSYTYADVRDSDTDQRLNNSPEHLAKFNLTAPLWREKVFANLEVLGMSTRGTVQGNTVSGYWLANFNLFSRKLVKGVELSGGVYNLFDRKYRDPVGSDFPEDSIQQNGRNFQVKLTYRF